MALFNFKKKRQPLHSISLIKKNVLSEKTSPHVQEAYKTIRTNLQYALHPINGKVMLVSSAMPGECKSTTSSNLAITFAQNSKVLLIDADMRKPVMHKIFGIDNSHGLSLFLGGFEPLSKALCRNVRPGLDVITAGSVPPNPSELLGSENMSLFIEKVKEYYDYIIIDTPPVNIVTDAVVLSDKVSGVVLVSRQNITTTKSMHQAIETLTNVNANILGIVLTGVIEKHKGFSRYSSYNGGTYGRSYSNNRYYSSYYKNQDRENERELQEESEKEMSVELDAGLNTEQNGRDNKQ
ncbi:MAG: CpsD/CapB family tyrosine-protein kinase [Clostridia bacterium]|nr:CpsD/CapB family tyrosine-protein kinase [Clostridia bacterium]